MKNALREKIVLLAILVIHLLFSVNVCAQNGLKADVLPNKNSSDEQIDEANVKKEKALDARDKWQKEAFELAANGTMHEAVKLGELVLATERKFLGEDHDDVLGTCSWLIRWYLSVPDFDRAEELANEQLRLTRQGKPDDHWQVVSATVNVKLVQKFRLFTAEKRELATQAEQSFLRAQALSRSSKFKEAKRLLIRVCESRAKVFGKDDPEYATALHRFALCQNYLGEYSEAEKNYLETLRIQELTYGSMHPVCAQTLDTLGQVCLARTKYEVAEKSFETALAIFERTAGNTSQKFLTALNSLAVLYDTTGDYPSAEKTYLRILLIYEKRNDKGIGYAIASTNLAYLRYQMGDLPFALGYAKEAVRILKNGTYKLQYAVSLHHLGLIYIRINENSKAENCLAECQKLIENSLGKQNAFYGRCLNGLASLREKQGKYEIAKKDALNSSMLLAKFLGKQHPEYLKSLIDLGRLNLRCGDKKTSEKMLKFTSQRIGDILGESHPIFIESSIELADFYRVVGQYEQAEKTILKSLNLSRALLAHSADFQSVRQHRKMENELRRSLNSLLSNSLEKNEFSEQVADQLLSWQGATLMRQRAMNQASANPEIADKFNRLQFLSRKISANFVAAQNGNATPDWLEKVAGFVMEYETLEKLIGEKSSTFQASMNSFHLPEIVDSLPDETAFISFIQFSRSKLEIEKNNQGEFSGFEWKNEPWIVAVLRSKNSKTRTIELGPVSEIQAHYSDWMTGYGATLKSQNAGSKIRELVWDRLPNDILKCKTILFVSEGILSTFPIWALPTKGDDKEKFLIEKHRFVALPAARMIPSIMSSEGTVDFRQGNLLLVGNVDYGSTISTKKYWNPLPGTAAEIVAIEKLYRQSNSSKISSLNQKNASESRVLDELAEAKIVHIATHGYSSLQDAIILGSKPNDSSVIDSALVLANANSFPAEQEGRKLKPELDDGLLRAAEISNTSLPNTRLVVLSSCESGKGPQYSGEGVNGLLRAFHIAGADTTIGSLWKVNDKATQLLMERFHRNLFDKKLGRVDALREAQLWMIRNPKIVNDAMRGGKDANAKNVRTSPKHWAAFILSGDWR